MIPPLARTKPIRYCVAMPKENKQTQIEGLPKGIDVYVGDARHMTAVTDGSVPFFMTSPPYWNLKNYGTPGEIGQSEYEHYLDELNEVWSECYRAASEHAVLVINVNSRRVSKRFYPIAFDIAARMRGWRLWDQVIWYVPNALPQPNHYMERLLDNKFESCLVFTKDGSTDYKFHKPRVPQKYMTADPREHKRNGRGRCLGNIVRIPAYRPPNVKKLGYHVAAYPEELVAFFLECYTDQGDTVLDPFVGSGTTMKIASIMGRGGIGYELNAEYAELIRRRVNEDWTVPDWRDLDIIHSSTMQTGTSKPRKVQHRNSKRDSHGVLFT